MYVRLAQLCATPYVPLPSFDHGHYRNTLDYKVISSMNSELKRQGNKNSKRINIHNDFMGPLQWSKDCLDLSIGQNQLLGHGFVIFNF